jgi:hypothetical protein
MTLLTSDHAYILPRFCISWCYVLTDVLIGISNDPGYQQPLPTRCCLERPAANRLVHGMSQIHRYSVLQSSNNII